MISVSERVSILAKAIIIILLLWLLNVLFIGIHELGHASLVLCFGAKICNMYISPIGYEGATSYTSLTNQAQSSLVLMGGILATTVATLVLYKLNIELAVYVLGLRTIESLFNFSRGSDMASLIILAGHWAYIGSLLLIGFTSICLWHTVYENRIKASHSIQAR